LKDIEPTVTLTRPLILGIETSCDETSVALVTGDDRIAANVIASQTEIHAPYGGVVPELASRAHVERFLPLLEEAWGQAGTPSWEDVDAVAVTHGPGLAGCLLVGIESAKGLALARGKPIVGVNHLAGHLWSVFLRDREGRALAQVFQGERELGIEEFRPPYLGLIVSGGHSSLCLVRGPLDIETVGQTLDDAAGEAYDKVAKLLGLGYPGGPVIDRLAREWSPEPGEEDWPLPRPLEGKPSLEFSFSGLKTAVVRLVEKRGGAESVAGDPRRVRGLCAAFQRRVIELLLNRAILALDRFGLDRLAVVGGVACNRGLREALRESFPGSRVVVAIPPPLLCTDNAAMIAAVGRHRFEAGRMDDLDLNAVPSLAF
jgi:N6-L-threonylcarbamoyladenine synthase